MLIIGAGPSGLSCAIEAKKHGLSYLLLEKGGISDAIRRFPTEMTFFSTPEKLEIGDIPFPLPTVRPSRAEALTYYQKLVEHFSLNIQLHREVVELQKSADGSFVLHDHQGDTYEGKNLILATGYFDRAKELGIPGEDLPHVHHFYTEAYAYAGSNVVVVGGSNSAVETALDLYRKGASVTLIHRSEKLSDSVKFWVRPDIENRIEEKSILAYFETELSSIDASRVHLSSINSETPKMIDAEFVFLLTGYLPDMRLLDQAGASYDPESLVPAVDLSFQTTVEHLFVAGSTTSGIHTNTVFIENGRLHAKPIIEQIRKQ